MPAPRTPTGIKEVKKTLRKNRQNKNEPKLPPVILDYISPPEKVIKQAHAKEVWDKMLPILNDMRCMTAADIEAFAVYCVACGIHKKAVLQFSKSKMTVWNAAGTQVAHPLINIINAQAKIIQAFSNEFGLTPAARSKVSGAPDLPDDPLNEFLQ